MRELLALKLPPREFVLEPIIRERDTTMIYSWRGIGKTMLGLYAAYAIAIGGDCLRWRAPKPRRVLYIDGELPLQTLQERCAWLISAQEAEPPDPAFLRFLTHDAQERGLPDLATREGQNALRPYIEPADVILFDSLSTLVRSAKENEAQGWQSMQDYLLELRSAGKTSAVIHHEGKGGTQRGTAKREDILDTTIHLKRPTDYSPAQGARFEVHFEKCRALIGGAVNPFEVLLDVRAGHAIWSTRDIAVADLARAAELYGMGMTVRDVAEELKISKSKAHRLKKVSQRPAA